MISDNSRLGTSSGIKFLLILLMEIFLLSSALSLDLLLFTKIPDVLYLSVTFDSSILLLSSLLLWDFFIFDFLFFFDFSFDFSISIFFSFISNSISFCCLSISLHKLFSSFIILSFSRYNSSGLLLAIIYISFTVEYTLGIFLLFLVR